MYRSAIFALMTLFSVSPSTAEEVSVFAAASMKTALDQFATDFQQKTGNTVTISYAGSNLLAKQIIDGAPADVYISANTGWMDEVEKAGLITKDGRRDILGNRLVLISHDPLPPVNLNAHTDLKGMLGNNKLAMALVDAVPAGQYGKEALKSLGLWDSVAPSVAQADNVRSALALVATGEAPFGIVYATDAHAETRVHVIGEFPESSYPTITYPAALLTGAKDPADKDFFNALSNDSANKIFTGQGFTPIN